MTTPKQGRVQIIVDGRTWFDQVCTDRHLEVDSDAHVTFTADWPSAINPNRVPGPTGTVLDGVLRMRYAFACEDCGVTEEFDNPTDCDIFGAHHECPPKLYLPSAEDLIRARNVVAGLLTQIAQHKRHPSIDVMDQLIKGVVVAMRWKPGDAE